MYPSPFQLDETGDDPDEFRVVRQDKDGNVSGDFIFTETNDGHCVLTVRRFNEANFGSLRIDLQ